MAVGWNDTFDGDTDFSATAVFNMFIDAMNERFPSFAIARVADGDDFQSPSAIAAIQSVISAHINGYVTPNPSADGWAWNGSDATPGILAWSWSNYKDAYMGGNEWTRKYPREFASAASTTYTDGSAFANGHVAQNIATGLVYNRTAGAWVVAAASTLPDTLTAYGTAVDGDYIGPWLFTEIRDALNRIIWKFGGGDDTSNNDDIAYVGGWNDTTWAAVVSGTDSTYAFSAGNSGAFFNPHAVTTGQYSSGGGNYSADAIRHVASRTALPDGLGVDSLIDFYVVMDAPDPGGGIGSLLANFDDNGDGFSYRVWKKWDSQHQSGASSVASAYIGTAAEPVWCDAPGDPPPTAKGYVHGKTTVIQRFDIVGGFAYSPIT